MVLNRRIFKEMLWVLSEMEALISSPNDMLRLRRLYLERQGVKFGNHLWVGRNLRLLNSSNISLGERCAIGDFVKIVAHSPISIGDDFLGASGLHLDSGTHDPITLQPNNLPIIIGNRVWCGVDVTIISGVTIGDNVVIGAKSLVCKDIPSNSIAVGVPANVIKPLDRSNVDSMWTWIC
jgi:maltose O-acetyltransferase